MVRGEMKGVESGSEARQGSGTFCDYSGLSEARERTDASRVVGPQSFTDVLVVEATTLGGRRGTAGLRRLSLRH